MPPALAITQLPEPGASALSPSLPCIPGPSRPRAVGAAGEPVSWSCFGGPSPGGAGSEGERTQAKGRPGEPPPRPGSGKGSCPALMTSLAPLDGCQLGSPVLWGLLRSEPAWAKLAQSQACQESSNRTPSPTPTCPGCLGSKGLHPAGPVCFAQVLAIGSKWLATPTPPEHGPATGPYYSLEPTPSPEDPPLSAPS